MFLYIKFVHCHIYENFSVLSICHVLFRNLLFPFSSDEYSDAGGSSRKQGNKASDSDSDSSSEGDYIFSYRVVVLPTRL